MNRYVLSASELNEIYELVESIPADTDLETDRYLMEAALWGYNLPFELKKKLIDFKQSEKQSHLVISGFPVNDDDIGLTPSHWRERPDPKLTRKVEIFFSLCGSILGDLFGWGTQQQGYYIHNILPVKGDENEQLGSGSNSLLWWHTEEAFHEYRADYLGLFCLRNPDSVATTYASIDMLNLEKKYKDVLFEPRFYILPDESHFSKNNVGQDSSEIFDQFEANYSSKQPLSILFGNYDSPYIRLDPFFMGVIDEKDDLAREAMAHIVSQIEDSIMDITLKPGDMLFVDNYRAVHGRKPFSPKYAGRDRWLKRINITRDLRKSRDSRKSAESRLIQPKMKNNVGVSTWT
ncbi:guanitoxin biosynthesis L-enduracididine beta-hydroxylase GntD [Paenibacillus sp. FSL R5-0486]|uniref:guanitoxin biosynthesis L-enduracididine beta-hydroxylase GntD n=1 Tax=Paenibacillus sp. FSL R5-0486 TaxID=2921645 RepID=UPI0030DDCB5E